MNTRVETKYLFTEGVSPFVKSLILKKRAGIKLTEKENKRLEQFNEVVSMVSPTSLHNRIVKPPKPIEDMEDDEEIDLDEILREMGYYDEEEDEELELGDYDEDDIREYVKEIVREDFYNKLK